MSAEWGTCFITVDSQGLARDTRSFSRQRLQWPTTSVLFLCCLTASSSQIVTLRFCCSKTCHPRTDFSWKNRAPYNRKTTGCNFWGDKFHIRNYRKLFFYNYCDMRMVVEIAHKNKIYICCCQCFFTFFSLKNKADFPFLLNKTQVHSCWIKIKSRP